MYFLSKHLPILLLDFNFKSAVARTFIGLGISIDLIALLSFRKSETTIDPRYPEKTSKLVIVGIYKYTRNPMYLGMLFILTGVGFYFGTLSVFFIVPLFVLYINNFQIIPEENVLKELFGETYTRYTQEVRRWI